MSRWNKGRVQTFALPLDALVKEKENTNRPIAARSAGTVGKWGITSFTSIRGPTYGYSSFSPKQELTHQNISPHSGETHASQAAQPSDAPKPKKFFKSRNVVPPTGNLTPPTQVEPIQLNTVPKISLKVNKKLLNPNDEVRKTKVEKSAKPKKVKKLKDETKLSVEKPTRFLSRTRKAVNYIEEHSRSPTPNYVALIDEHMALAERVSEEAMETTTTDRKEPSTDTSNVLPIAEDALEIATKAVAQVTHDHPPIVLRISKGTSRLISTDSEEVIRSPASQSPLQQPPTVANPSGSLTTTAELLAVLSDDPPAQENVIPEEPVAPPVEHKPEGIKIKIKKHLAQAFITSNGNDAKPVVPPVARRNTRAARRTQLEEVVKNETMKDNSPQPGNENYELYRTLASPAEDKDFDSQSSVLGSISSVCVPSGVPEDSQVIHSRGSSHVSSEDADDQEETSQDSSLLAAPSEIDTRLATMMDYEVETPPSKPVETKVLPKRNTRSRVKSPQQTVSEIVKPPEPEVMERRSTRNNNNGMLQKSTVEELSRPPIKSYGRKRKTTKQDESSNNEPSFTSNETTDPTLLPPPTVPVSQSSMNSSPDQNKIHNSSEHKVYRKVRKINMDDVSTDSNKYANNNLSMGEDEKPSVKLVISKKKGSIFKSRAIAAANSEGENKKRHVYKHKWDDDSKDKTIINDPAAKPVNSDAYYNDFDEDGESSGLLTRVTRQRSPQNYDESEMTSVKCDTKAKKFYTVVRNVKKAHQIQEIGEFQEMDDDVEYILDALQSQNPMSTRCLSAIQLASKCMTPAFRMHLRAHGTITKFFKALHDASKDQSLGLCTATVMFVLNQDNLNMDLDRDSLELMLNLLESDVSHTNALDDCGLTKEQLQRNKSKVRELCAEIKNQGKAVHLNLDNITVGTLAMETLLSLTSKRAGEWFKEELRELGGLEHIIVTICECCRQISDYVVDWTEALLEKLRKIERCLRVLENVSTQNEENQSYILSYKNGHAVDTLVNFYKLCDSEIALYPTNDQTPKDNPGIVLREALVPTLKVLINLTHPFNEKSAGSAILGEKLLIFDTSLHLLLQAPHYVPEGCIFELSILVLLLLINLTMYTLPNRIVIMKANAPSDHNQFNKVPAIKALIEYFYKCEEMARLVEQNTDDILDNPNKAERKTQSQEEVEETVTKLLQKAGHHMEHTMLASYVCILVGHLVIDCNDHEQDIRRYLINGQFTEMVQILEKYYNFMNLTASYEASHVAHIKQTKMIIDYLKKSDKHSTSTSSDNENLPLVATSQSATSANNKQPTYSTYSSSNSSAASSTFFSNSQRQVNIFSLMH